MVQGRPFLKRELKPMEPAGWEGQGAPGPHSRILQLDGAEFQSPPPSSVGFGEVSWERHGKR